MGHSVKRKEDPRFIRGQGEYIDDVSHGPRNDSKGWWRSPN